MWGGGGFADVKIGTIDKVGGLDAYLTGSKPARIRTLGPTGWRLRWRVMNSPRYQKQLAEERKALGLEAGAMPQESMFGEAYGDVSGLVGEMVVETEAEVVEVEKTPAQLLVEKIERLKGLRK